MPTAVPSATGETLRARKVFHVSPFCEVRGHYAFRFHFGPARWLARIDYFDDANARTPLLATSISGRIQPLGVPTVRSLLVRYRWFTLGVVAAHPLAGREAVARSAFPSSPSRSRRTLPSTR